MELNEIETGLFELAEVTQDMLLAVEFGQRQASEEFREQLRTIMNLFGGSNCYIAIFKERIVVRPDKTMVTIQHELIDYCFVDHESDGPKYYCEVSVALIIDGTRGHPVPSKGNISIRIVCMPMREESDELGQVDQPPRCPDDEPVSEEEQKKVNELLRKMGFDVEGK